MRRIQVYDTTLRDGAQGEGVSFSLEDKLLLTRRLDSLGFDYVEGGYPASNPKDSEYFQRIAQERLSRARVCAFGMTRRKGAAVQEDEGLASLLGRVYADRHGRRQGIGLSRHRGPARDPGREPGDDRRERRPPPRGRARGDLRRRALLRRLEGQPALRAQDGPAPRPRPEPCSSSSATPTAAPCPRTLGRSPRQRRGPGFAAAGHPLPQRLRAGRGQHAGRGGRGGRAGAGHDQRLRRAVRQRRPAAR